MFFLVRHAIYGLGTGMLAGRMPGVSLTDKGHAQAERLAERLEREGVTAVHASPQHRTLETARPIAQRCGVAIEVIDALDEVDFGSWSGKSFEALESEPDWRSWNAERDSAATPAGETMASLTARVTGHIARCLSAGAGGRFVLVTHAEPIRSAILHYLSLPPNAYTRVDIDPASISQLVFADGCMRIAGLNERVAA